LEGEVRVVEIIVNVGLISVIMNAWCGNGWGGWPAAGGHTLGRIQAYPKNAIVYKKSKMYVILQVDASYLTRSHARSVAGGVAYLGDTDNPTKENGMIFAISSIIDVVVSSAGKAEYGAAFIFAQHGVGLRNTAIALGHPQPPTPILCDNQFAIGLATDTIK
jgi:hypothetical protein